MHPAPLPSRNRASERLRYWQRVRRLTFSCLAAWFGVTFLVIFFARDLTELTFLNWPLSFYMAAQGLTLFYVLIIGVYALLMRRYDKDLNSGTANEE